MLPSERFRVHATAQKSWNTLCPSALTPPDRELVMRALLFLSILSFTAASASAQVPDSARRDSARVAESVLPADVATRVAEMYNQPAALRANGSLELPAAQTVTGDVAVLHGPLTIAGRVTGRVLAINADVSLRPGARVDGDLVVVGGVVEGQDDATIGGEIQWYRQVLRYRLEGERIVVDHERELARDDDSWFRRWRHRRSSNRSRITLMTGGTYNRVEGLPILVGPTIRQSTHWGELRFEALGIIRSAENFRWSSQNLGHDVTAEVELGRERRVVLGGRLFDVVDAVERWHLRDSEVGLAAFFLHRDYRDYYNRHGAGGHLTLGTGDGVDLRLGYSVERWGARRDRDPFSLFRNDATWRPNPLVDEGRFRIATATLTFDTRTDPDRPWSGWYIVADVERGTSRSVRLGPTSSLARAPSDEPVTVTYTRGFLDLRRYNRVSPRGQLNLRAVLAGWLDGDELPLQRRLSVGGFETIPGYDFRRVPEAGATDVFQCSDGSEVSGRPAQCERIALVQVEYRGDLHLRLGGRSDSDDGDRDWLFDFSQSGSWVLFVDAGRGWLVGPDRIGTLQYRSGELPRLNSFRSDVGAGLDFGFLGLFVAKSVTDSDEPANFFVRLRHRF